MDDSIGQEQSVFLVDANQQIFAFRSYRAQFMMEKVKDIQEAIDILVGDDLQCADFRADCKEATRGPHMPIIIGHHRQSAKVSHFGLCFMSDQYTIATLNRKMA